MRVLGPRLRVPEEDGGRAAHSPDVPGPAVRVRTLIEARLPEPTCGTPPTTSWPACRGAGGAARTS